MPYKLSEPIVRKNESLHNKLISNAEKLVPVLKERSSAANEARRIPVDTINDLRDAGFFKILQPKKYGGYELDPHTFFEVQMKIAEGCMSSAWVLGIIAVHPFQLALYDEKAQEEVLSLIHI